MARVYKVKAFKKTISGTNTAEVLASTTDVASGRLAQSVLLLAPSGNSGTVYIGGSDVDSTNGFPMAGGTSVNLGDLRLNSQAGEWDLHSIYVYGTANDTIRVLQSAEVSTS